MTKTSDVELFKITFGDIESLTPMQRMDLIDWYFQGDLVGSCDSEQRCSMEDLIYRVKKILRRHNGISIPVLRNRLRNIFALEDIERAIGEIETSGEIVKVKSKTGKNLYSIAKDNQ